MPRLNINNVVRVSVLSPLRGLADVNTSALALITDDQPIPSDYGTARTYLDPTAVAQDFGTTSTTAAIANIIFSQSPNILTGRGYLVIIPRDPAAAASPAVLQSMDFTNLNQLTGDDYHIRVAVDGNPAADLEIGEIDTTSRATIEDSLNSAAVSSADLVFSVSGEPAAARVTLSTTTTGAASSILIDAATTGTDIAPLLGLSGSASGADAGLETFKNAIIRAEQDVPFFGIISNTLLTDELSNAEIMELAQTVQARDKLLFVSSDETDDIAGVFTDIQQAGLTHTRTLCYTLGDEEAILFSAGYASSGLSTNFSGTNTARTMELKEVVGLIPDPGISQSIADAASDAGVDLYVDYGVPKLKTSGANQFFDQIYSTLALKLRLSIAGFNLLATVPTKIPQTEQGVSQLKSSYRRVCTQFVENGTFAPGEWTSAVTYGDPDDHKRNIRDSGFYVFSQPIGDQSPTDRQARIAPLVQIAAKSSGAIHSTDVTIFIEP